MAKITQLKKGNENVYPLVHMDGVVDDNGNSISTMWDTKQDKLISGTSLKTVNGTSLLGSGDIAVVSVDAGDISVLQSTGTSLVDVMSQNAVSSITDRVTNEDVYAIDTEKRLPFGYTEVEWVDNGSAGSGAVIDTELVPDDANWRFEGSWMRTGTPTNNYASIISNYKDTATCQYIIQRNNGNDANLRVCAYVKDSGAVGVSITNSTTLFHTYILKFGEVTIDGSKTTLNTTAGGSSNSVTLKLCSTTYPQKVGEFKAYHNDVLVANLVPCVRNDGVVGMYDIVRSAFYSSSNANSFIAGPIIAGGRDKLITGHSLMQVIDANKVTANDLAGTSDFVKSKLKEQGWLFGKAINSSGQIVDSSSISYCVTPKIPLSAYNHVLHLWFGANSVMGIYATAYDNNDVVKANYQLTYYNVYRLGATAAGWETATYMRMTVYVDKLAECYVYDETTDEFLFKGIDYVNNAIKSKLVDKQSVSIIDKRVEDGDFICSNISVRNKLTELGWRFSAYNTSGGYINPAGTAAKASMYVTSPLIPCWGLYNHTIDICYNYAGDSNIYATTHLLDKSRHGYYNLTANNLRQWQITTASYADVKYIKFTLNASEFANCYIYDRTVDKYIFKGDDYLAQHLEGLVDYHYLQENIVAQSTGVSTSKLMSQKAVTDELSIATNKQKVSYLQGRLALFELSDYSQLDPRTADGISIVFTTNKKPSGRCPIFAIFNPDGTNNGFGNPNFSLCQWDANIKWGKVTSYFTVQTGGYSLTAATAHHVLTYDFKTGIVKYYKNGVLDYTSTAPSGYNEQDLRDYFTTCTHIGVWSLGKGNDFKTNGIAVFGSVLEDADVAKLFGSGNACIRSHLIPTIYKANNLHPIYPINWGVNMWNSGGANGGTYTDNGNGTFTIIPTSGYSYVYFGFNGITDVINNVTYEWDFTIDSGSSTYSTSRRMRYSNLYVNFTIYDSNGNDVSIQDLSTGSYHVICKPDNVYVGNVNANYGSSVYLHYYFPCSSDFSITVSNLKVTERGAALECSTDTYRGDFWELANGIRLPMHPPRSIYSTATFYANNDTYLEDVQIYSSSLVPQFNGQIAINTTNGNTYIGYLTASGGTWKQVNNS